ncbi:MAG: hypothetical protein CME16_02505 [Gemmatimonadetes bacterium]|nr:hypothetical protein [Gemmatimonadota bacterium]
MFDPLSSIRRNAAFIGALFFGFIAALPWLVHYSYSRGYDLFLWVYNAWYFKKSIADLSLPNWSYFSASGQPFFKIGGLSDSVVLALLTAGLGTFGGMKAFVALFYLVAAAGCYVLGCELIKDRIGAMVGTGAYVLCWFLTVNIYFQGYLSNFMSYALLPWFAWLYYRAVHRRSLQCAILAGLILFLSLTSNAQVALKLFAFISIWVLLSGALKRAFFATFLRYSLVIGVVGLWGAFFNIVSALALRSEIVTLSSRVNSFHSPLELFRLPAYVLNWIIYKIFGLQVVQIPLVRLPFSGYPGLSVLALGAASWAFFQRTKDRHLAVLWVMIGGLYLIYFYLIGFIPGSSWFGISHNLLVFPALFLALVCGFGVMQIRYWVRRRFPKAGECWSSVLIVSLLIADLGGASLGLNYFAASGTPPNQLPEVRAWKALEGKSRGDGTFDRLFTYNPDHTFYLYPVLMNKPVANVIELRQRNREYQMYLNFLKQQLHAPQNGFSPAQFLALLNVGFIDVPSKAFFYSPSDVVEGARQAYRASLELFDGDPALRRVFQRDEGRDDWRFARRSSSPEALKRIAPEDPGLAQVIYASERVLPAFWPERVVAVVGNTMKGEAFFEDLIQITDFAPEKVGFLLIDGAGQLSESEKAVLTGWHDIDKGSKGMGDVSALDRAEIRTFYKNEEFVPPPLQLQQVGKEGLEVALEAVAEDRYVFISQQYFKSWRAFAADGRMLPVRKAGAGLTAVFVPGGVEKITLKYETPWYEKGARFFSLLGLCVFSLVLVWAVLKENKLSISSGHSPVADSGQSWR